MGVMLDVYRRNARRAAIRSRSRLMSRLSRLGLLLYAHVHLAKRMQSMASSDVDPELGCSMLPQERAREMV